MKPAEESPMAQDLDNLLERIGQYEAMARELTTNFRILAQWELKDGEEDQVRMMLGNAVTRAKELSVLQGELLEELSHLQV
jgi:hypothetical protein